MRIICTIAGTSAEEAVNRYVPSRNAKTRRRHYRRYYRVLYAALHALAERLRYTGNEGMPRTIAR